MLIGTSLIGIGGGGTFVGIMVSMTDVLPLQIGLAMGLFELAAYGGSSIGTYLGGILTIKQGLRYPFYIFILLSALGAIAALLFMPETRNLDETSKVPRIISREYFSDFLRIFPLCIAGFSSKIMDS
jgi:MFS family permease